MIIDVHNHPDYHGYSPERFLQNMDENGVDKTFLLSWEAPVTDYDPASKHLLSPHSDDPIPFLSCVHYYEKAPDRFYLGFSPDPRQPNAIERLKAMTMLYDIKLCGEFKLRMVFDDPDALRMFRYCGEIGLPVLVHIDYEFDAAGSYPWPNYWYGGGIEAFGRALEACPDTIFLGHAPGFWAHISGDGQHITKAYPRGPVVPGGQIQALLERCPNLYCDISAHSGYNALNRDPEHAKTFLTQYQDRVVFGRDCFETWHRTFLDNAGLPADVLEKIYCGNVNRICRLGL